MMATVSLMAGLSLERDVELTVETTDGTAIGTSTSLGFSEVQPCSLYFSRRCGLHESAWYYNSSYWYH